MDPTKIDSTPKLSSEDAVPASSTSQQNIEVENISKSDLTSEGKLVLKKVNAYLNYKLHEFEEEMNEMLELWVTEHERKFREVTRLVNLCLEEMNAMESSQEMTEFGDFA